MMIMKKRSSDLSTGSKKEKPLVLAHKRQSRGYGFGYGNHESDLFYHVPAEKTRSDILKTLNKIIIAGTLAIATICGTGFSFPQTKAEAASVCVIPGRSANYQQIRLPARQADFSENAAEFEEPKQVKTFAVVEKTYIGILPEPEEERPECPISEDEIVMLAKVLKRECGGLSSQGTKYGVTYTARQAAVAWCALNRLDDPRYPDTLAGVLTYPGAFAWIPATTPGEDMLWLARDVVDRWWREKCGEADVGRTLAADFFFFAGNGKENRFRNNYFAPFVYWDWSGEDPYKEE